MGKSFLKNYWQLLFFNILILLAFIIFYGRFGDVIVDSFREAYIPQQMIEGQILYKNIFNIYAPLSYIINALLFAIFGTKLSVLYFAGLIATLGITNLTFKISEMFTDKNTSLCVVLFLIAGSILSPNVFNFIFPYSYGMLYGLLFILGSVYFALNKKFPYAYFLYSLAVCSKYEFILLLPLLVYASWKKDILKNIIAFIMPFLITIILLFIQKAGVNNILASFEIILHMGSAKTLAWFYSVMGLVFRWEIIPIYILNLIKIFVPILIYKYFPKYWLIPIILVYLYFTTTPEIIVFAFPLILILFGKNFYKLNYKERFFIIASLLISMKVFFALTLQAYGVFFIPFALISIFILIPSSYKKSLVIIIILSTVVLSLQNIEALVNKNVKLEASRGVIYANKTYGESINALNKYIEKNTSKDDRVIIYPEGLITNFMTERKSDNKFYSLIPLYIETFGEDIIIQRLDIIKPEYIVISNYNTSNYYYSGFGKDYAGRICMYIAENYEKQASIGENFKFLVFKRRLS